MSSTPLHPAIVHLPLALSLLVPLLAIGVALAVHRGKLPRWVWGGVLGLQLMLVGSGFLAMRSGENDEEIVENVVSHDIIHEHEEKAELFVYTAAGLSVLFLLGLALPRRSWRSGAMALAAVGSIGVGVLGLNTGHSGGELIYVHGAASAHLDTPAGEARSAALEIGPAPERGEHQH